MKILHYLNASGRDPYQEWLDKLKDPLLAKLVIAKVSGGHAINPALNGDARREVFEFVQPLLVRVAARRAKVVADLH